MELHEGDPCPLFSCPVTATLDKTEDGKLTCPNCGGKFDEAEG